MKSTQLYGINILLVIFFIFCRNPINQTLEIAEDNRIELEAVLKYYEEQGDKQKLNAAKFLIENMQYKFEYKGDILNKYDSIFYLYQSLRNDSI